MKYLVSTVGVAPLEQLEEFILQKVKKLQINKQSSYSVSSFWFR